MQQPQKIKILNLLDLFETAAVDNAASGGNHPDDIPAIEEDYKEVKKELVSAIFRDDSLLPPKLVRVTRVLIYEGDIRWLDTQLGESIDGVKILRTPYGEARIYARTIEPIPKEVEPDATPKS